MTTSTRYADLLFPDVSTLESDELINNAYPSGAYHYVIRLQAVIEPMWENHPTALAIPTLLKSSRHKGAEQ